MREILVAESSGFSPDAEADLRALGAVRIEDLDRRGLLREVSTADVLWVRLRNRIDREVICAAPRLRAVVTPTTGLNHIDVEALDERGIALLSLRGETEFLRTIRATAEHTIALILALLRHLPAAVTSASQGEWDRDRFRGYEMYGKTAGVIGYGRLGRIVARYLRAFDMRVLASDPNVGSDELEEGVELMPLGDLLAQSEVITLHVNLTAGTRGMMGSAAFNTMKPGAWFVNTSRGELVDEPALLAALRSGRLRGAALDVLADESADEMAQSAVVQYAAEGGNVILTPHIGGATVESMARTEEFMAGRLKDFLSRQQVPVRA